MKLLIYSDLHLEFGTDFKPPVDSDADIMILAGDILIYKNFTPLTRFLEGWDKPVLCIAGNHEHYTKRHMRATTESHIGNIEKFIGYLTINHPNVTFLDDESITIDGINFFGGTMWTDFDNFNPMAMMIAQQGMNDYQLIHHGYSKLCPQNTVDFHNEYIRKLKDWFETPMEGERVVISHHAPVDNPNSGHYSSQLKPAYVCTGIRPIIEEYQPALWIYGHTHERDRQMIGETQIISNPRGYPYRSGGSECKDFDANGVGFIV